MKQKFHSVTPSRLPIYRAIVGDVSDNLKPPIPRFPKDLAAIIAESLPYNGTIPTKENLKELFSSFKDITASKKDKLNLLLENYDLFKSNFEIMKLSVYKDVFYSYLKDGNQVIPNFPPVVMSIYRSIRVLDSSKDG